MSRINNSLRETILLHIKKRLMEMRVWEIYQSEMATLVINLPERITGDNLDLTIKKLKGIKSHLLDMGLSMAEVKFINEEIKRFKGFSQMYAYKDNEKTIHKDDINNFATLGFGTEGVIGIPQTYNYEQIKYLTTRIWQKTKQVKFYISRERIIIGKVIAEVYEFPQRIPVVKIVEKRSKTQDEIEEQKLILFGENFDPKGYMILKEIESPFYIYRFVTNEGIESILLSHDKLTVGEKMVTGMTTFRHDNKQLTDSAKLSTKLMYIIAQEVENKIASFKNTLEFQNYCSVKEFKPEDIMKFPFSYKNKEKDMYSELSYPGWYKSLIWSWLLHNSKGVNKSYPTHLLIVGDRGSGKSTTMELLHEKTQEISPMFSGSSSTLKSLVPSFKNNPPKIGYMAESSRFAFCDEFFRCVLRDSNKNSEEKEEQIAILNDLLEHKKRAASSGNGSVTVNMRAKVIATTNPIRDTKNLSSLLKRFDTSFLSRWIIVFQDKEIIDCARSGTRNIVSFKSSINEIEFTSVLDFMQSFSANYSLDRLHEIFVSVKSVLSRDLLDHYEARHEHHIECIMDGIVKERCLRTNCYDYNAIEEDYLRLKFVWQKVIASWIPINNLMKMDARLRINYMPERCQYLFWKMAKEDRELTRLEVEKLVSDELSIAETREILIMLLEKEILTNETNFYSTPFKNRKLTENEIAKANTIIQFIPTKS